MSKISRLCLRTFDRHFRNGHLLPIVKEKSDGIGQNSVIKTYIFMNFYAMKLLATQNFYGIGQEFRW